MSEKAKHTPGPWSMSESLGNSNSYRIEAEGLCVRVYGKDKYLPTGESVKVKKTQADANLIAAAPDLLEHLVGAHTTLERLISGYRESELAAEIRETIAKAKGGAA